MLRKAFAAMVVLTLMACCAVAAIAVPWASPAAVESLVTAAGPSGPFGRNSNDEPAMAVDASRPNVLAIGAHERMDQQPCSRAASTTSGALHVFCKRPLD